MRVFAVLSVYLLLASTIVASQEKNDLLDFQGFEPLPVSPQEFDTIQLGLVCPDDVIGSRTINVISWTIEPVVEESVVIKTLPPNLVDARAQNGVLRFGYNQISLANHDGGTGVLVQVPYQQLQQVFGAANTSFAAQVLPGFTSLSNIAMESFKTRFFVSVHDTTLVDLVHFADYGTSNDLYLGSSGKSVNVTLAGRDSFVVMDGTVTTGLLSGTNNFMRVFESIEHLKVTGTKNRIVTSTGLDEDPCENIEFVMRLNSCEVTPLGVTPPFMDVVSADDMDLQCPFVLPGSSSSGSTSSTDTSNTVESQYGTRNLLWQLAGSAFFWVWYIVS